MSRVSRNTKEVIMDFRLGNLTTKEKSENIPAQIAKWCKDLYWLFPGEYSEEVLTDLGQRLEKLIDRIEKKHGIIEDAARRSRNWRDMA